VKHSDSSGAPDWPVALHRALSRAEVCYLPYVPDAGHKTLLELAHADSNMTPIALTTEQEGIAVAAGVALGGGRAALLMQSSGVGNCINAIASITQACRMSLLMLVTMRGEWGEKNPWQVPMGAAVAPILNDLGVTVLRLERGCDAESTLAAVADQCFAGGGPVALLISQRLIGAKAFTQ